jgi:tellurite resistance protein
LLSGKREGGEDRVKDYQDAMLRSLVAVAWADGHWAQEEAEVIEALISTFALSEADAAKVREFAKTKRTLDDVPVTELSMDDRQMLLQHAVLLSHIDGGQHETEIDVIDDLVDRLHIPEKEADALIAAANTRAKRLLDLL